MSNTAAAGHRKTTVIKPRGKLELVGWRELFEYRDLLYFMVSRDIKARYAQSVLGFGWAILRPTITMVIFSVVFGNLAEVGSDGLPYPLFSFVGLVPWTYFASSVGTSAGSLVGGGLVSKVYFPRLIIPLSPVLSNLVDFAIAFVLIAPLMFYYGYAPPATIVMLPALILLMVISAAGIGFWLAALAVQYRDVKFALTFVVSLMMYAAPVAWPASEVPERFRLAYGVFSMAGVIEGFRAVVVKANPIPWDLLLSGSISALVIFVSGAIYFTHRQDLYADVQ